MIHRDELAEIYIKIALAPEDFHYIPRVNGLEIVFSKNESLIPVVLTNFRSKFRTIDGNIEVCLTSNFNHDKCEEIWIERGIHKFKKIEDRIYNYIDYLKIDSKIMDKIYSAPKITNINFDITDTLTNKPYKRTLLLQELKIEKYYHSVNERIRMDLLKKEILKEALIRPFFIDI